jgi:predicted metal-dependent peptidase
MSKLSKAKARLLMDHPFFATLLIRTPVEVTERVALAATDGEKIYFNPHFLDECSVEDTMAVLAHEVGHDSLLHSLRLGLRNHDIWNQAGDHAINLMLEDQGFSCPKSVPGGWLADRKYKGWSADRIYDDLRRNPPPKPKKGKGKPGEGDGDGDDESEGGAGSEQDGDGKQRTRGPGKPSGTQNGRDWLHGDVLPSPAKNPAEQAVAEQRAKQKVASAANMARMAGKLKGELARMVGEFLDSKVHWTDVLRDYMLKVVKARDSWQRRNRRFKQVYLPTRHEKKMGPIIFVPDTSGSMWGDDMEKICSEMAHCSAQTRPEHIRVVWADTQVAGEQVFEPTDFEYKKLKPVGGGGTDMRVPLKYVEKYNPQVVVLMTDGHTPWPDKEPPFPLIVICTTDVACPIGQVIRV